MRPSKRFNSNNRTITTYYKLHDWSLKILLYCTHLSSCDAGMIACPCDGEGYRHCDVTLGYYQPDNMSKGSSASRPQLTGG